MEEFVVLLPGLEFVPCFEADGRCFVEDAVAAFGTGFLFEVIGFDDAQLFAFPAPGGPRV